MRRVVLLFSLTALLCGCSNKRLDRSDYPIPRVSAVKRVSLPLPVSARNVYFLDFAGGMQDLERYVRFDVDRAELDSAVGALLAENNKMFSRNLQYSKKPLLAVALASPRKDFLPMVWWNPSTVQKGYFRGEVDAYALQVWVDEDASRIYIYQND